MNKCPFCLENKIIKGDIPAENDLCYFVESIDPVLDCGGMIIPKRHISSPFELTTDEWLATKDLLDKVKTILDKNNPDGYNIAWNVGKIGGQEINHVHLHVIARFADEPLAGKGVRYFLKQKSNMRE